MSDLWSDIAEHFEWNWMYYALFAAICLPVLGCLYMPNEWFETERTPAVVTDLAEGTIVGIRATGAWENWCKIELKFDDGVVLLTSYYFIREYNIREGRRYLIQRNSRVGKTATELK